jgi:pimeloyl-ACP methyl ester carboxylesterase
MKKILSYALLYGICASTMVLSHEPTISTDKYFDTSFLANHDQVFRSLKEAQFEEITFKSTDGLRLEGLYLKRPHARFNVICCAGWWPGRKEGIATFYKLLPQDCNILFFDARGHGNSEGSFRHVSYGVHDYKDIVGALEFMQKDTNKPTLIYGICAGAFNAAHAILELQKQNRLEELHVSGLIFDSGWVCVDKTAHSVATSKANEMIMKQIASWYALPHYRDAKKTSLFSCFSTLAQCVIGCVHMFLKPFIKRHDFNTNLLIKAQQTPMSVPCLFIHSQDDVDVSLNDVKKLSALVPNKTCWWIDKPSKHACHHLKHTNEYKKYIDHFITLTMQY